MNRIADLEDVRQNARQKLPKSVFDYVDGGAGSERTALLNLKSWKRIHLRARAMVDVGMPDITVELFGDRFASPVALGPAGMARMVDPKHGELAVARAANEERSLYVVSTGSSVAMERVAEEATGPIWFQLYPWRTPEVTDSLVDRAAEAGYKALCLTVDTPISGHRPRDIRNGLSYPAKLSRSLVLQGLRRPKWTWHFLRTKRIGMANLFSYSEVVDARPQGTARFLSGTLAIPTELASWTTAERVRSKWTGPMLLKGITDPSDASRAIDAGADGLIVSNHGGRQLDGLPGSADLLRAVSDHVGGKTLLMVDGGIRSGADVIRAKALGASACLIGRPYLYGLGADGERGVRSVIDFLKADTRRALILAGHTSFESVGTDAIYSNAGGQ